MMAPWLALTTDGMLLAALVVIWVRRHRRERVGVGPWAAFWAGMAATIAANLAAAQPSPVGVVVALWPPVCLAITLELIALVASVPTQYPVVRDARPRERTGHLPEDDELAPGHVPAEAHPDGRAPEIREPSDSSGTGTGHPPAEVPAEPVTEPARVSQAVPVSANGHPYGHGIVPVGVPDSSAPEQPDVLEPAAQAPVPASGHGLDMELAPEAGHNGHHGPARCERASDGDILAWLCERLSTSGLVPGRRNVIDRWAVGSTRAERLRRIVLVEAAEKAAASASGREFQQRPGR